MTQTDGIVTETPKNITRTIFHVKFPGVEGELCFGIEATPQQLKLAQIGLETTWVENGKTRYYAPKWRNLVDSFGDFEYVDKK